MYDWFLDQDINGFHMKHCHVCNYYNVCLSSYLLVGTEIVDFNQARHVIQLNL